MPGQRLFFARSVSRMFVLVVNALGRHNPHAVASQHPLDAPPESDHRRRVVGPMVDGDDGLDADGFLVVHLAH